MPEKIRVLHLSSHLGGGVGRVLSKLNSHNRNTKSIIEDSFICLEEAEDRRYADQIKESGAKISVRPSTSEIQQEIERADIVQVEWWHHPLLAKELVSLSKTPARWIVWSHTSGLHYPTIPVSFSKLPHTFITSTPASMPLLDNGKENRSNLISCISSTGGFDDFPTPDPHRNGKKLRSGYLGSLNPSKLHPRIDSYIESVPRSDFLVEFYGDSSVNPRLEEVIRGRGQKSKILLCGFSKFPQKILPTLDLFIYLLNPTHYGTTENALLEAMACGVLPIVFNNPVESGIVQHGVTGFIVDSPRAFSSLVCDLIDHPDECRRIGKASAEAVRENFSISRSAQKLQEIYITAMNSEKKAADYVSVFGKTPADMFLSCLGQYVQLFAKGKELSFREKRLALPFLYEQTKSSVRHFLRYFPNDALLNSWAVMLQSDEVSRSSSSSSFPS